MPASVWNGAISFGLVTVPTRMLQIDEGMTVDPASVVVTVGCQEAVLLALRALFTGADDVLLVDSPCYVGITGAAGILGIDVVAVPDIVHGRPGAMVRLPGWPCAE